MTTLSRIGIVLLVLGWEAVPRPAQGLAAAPGEPPAKPAKVPLSELAKALKNKDAEVRQEAIKGLARRGIDSIPLILEALKDEDEVVRQGAAYLLLNQPVDPKALLERLKPAARDDNPLVRRGVAGALGRCGAEALPLLVEAAKDRDAEVRHQAAKGLGMVVRKDPKAAEAVRAASAKLLHDDTPAVRLAAVQTLARCGPEAVPDLFAALKDQDAKVRGTAVTVLSRTKVPSETLLPALAALLKDEKEPVVKQTALRTLAKLGPEAAPALAGALADEDPGIQVVALKGLAQIGPKAKEAVPAVKELAVKASRPAVRAQAISTLGQLGPDGLPPLLEMLKGADSETRLDLLRALAHTEKLPKAAVPPLVETLGDKSADVRILGAYVLGQLGPDAREAEPVLSKLLKDPEPNVQKSAAKALEQIQGK